MASPQSSSDLPPPPVSQIRSIFEGIAAKSTTNNSPASKVVPLPQPSPKTSKDHTPKSSTREDHASTAAPELIQALKRQPPPPPTSTPLTRAGLVSSSRLGVLSLAPKAYAYTSSPYSGSLEPHPTLKPVAQPPRVFRRNFHRAIHQHQQLILPLSFLHACKPNFHRHSLRVS